MIQIDPKDILFKPKDDADWVSLASFLKSEQLSYIREKVKMMLHPRITEDIRNTALAKYENTFTLILKYDLKDKVKILELGLPGRVSEIAYTLDRGLRYQVEYFANGEIHLVWLWEEDIELIEKGRNYK